jgi:D-aspartate ligase
MADRLTTVVLALTGTGMAVARAAAPLGPVHGVDADRTRPGRYSRWVQTWPWMGQALDASLVAHLLDFARSQPHPVVVVPAADDACAWAISHAAALSGGVRISTGYTAERAGVLLDKWQFGARCRELGIDVPQTLLPQDLGDVRAFAAEVGLPCIVKPRAGHLWRSRLSGQKLLVCDSLDGLMRVMEEVVGDPRAVVLQELVPGPESNLGVAAVWVDQQGSVRSSLTARKIRQFPRQFGSGSRVVTEDLAEVRELSAAVLSQFDYRGLCGTEFKFDPRHRRWRLIEINPRPTLWYDLCRAAGHDLVAAHLRELAGLAALPLQPQRQGVVWSYWLRDVVALGQAGGPRAVWQAMRHEGVADTDAVMALTDPGATVAAGAHFVGQALSHLWVGKKGSQG